MRCFAAMLAAMTVGSEARAQVERADGIKAGRMLAQIELLEYCGGKVPDEAKQKVLGVYMAGGATSTMWFKIQRDEYKELEKRHGKENVCKSVPAAIKLEHGN